VTEEPLSGETETIMTKDKKSKSRQAERGIFFAVLPRLLEIEKERDESLTKSKFKREREEQLEYLLARKSRRGNPPRIK
jgi:hypothetical protein